MNSNLLMNRGIIEGFMSEQMKMKIPHPSSIAHHVTVMCIAGKINSQQIIHDVFEFAPCFAFKHFNRREKIAKVNIRRIGFEQQIFFPLREIEMQIENHRFCHIFNMKKCKLQSIGKKFHHNISRQKTQSEILKLNLNIQRTK